MALAAGTRLGPYEILAPVGAAGMGEAYRARETRLGREVAIKVLPAELSADGGRLRRFEKEARSASSLNHPNIVTVYDIGTSDSTSYLAMEPVDGVTLRQLLAEGAPPIKKVLGIAAQVAEGLAIFGSPRGSDWQEAEVIGRLVGDPEYRLVEGRQGDLVHLILRYTSYV